MQHYTRHREKAIYKAGVKGTKEGFPSHVAKLGEIMGKSPVLYSELGEITGKTRVLPCGLYIM